LSPLILVEAEEPSGDHLGVRVVGILD